MDKFEYTPYHDLQRIFQDPQALADLPALIKYVNHHKLVLNSDIKQQINANKKHLENQLQSDSISELIHSIETTQEKSKDIQASVQSITTEISKLDSQKKNLTLSMNIFKRLQILNYSINELNQLLRDDYHYKDIHSHLSNIKDLLEFFQPYKSIDEINKLNMVMHKIQTKLIDNIFIDFEEILVYNKPMKELKYACKILELIDLKQKDKLLTWFYNLQLKEIKTIFNNFDEAGSLDNLNRRFIYFNNTFQKVQKDFATIFPDDWSIQLELSKLFCELTKEDIMAKLDAKKISAETLLVCLNVTLDFENSLNSQLNTTYFTKTILKVFEPYLSIWINEQDKVLNAKLIEFYSIPKIPQEFQAANNFVDFTNVLKVNSIPNISNSSIELFRLYQKVLVQTIKLSNGKILIDLANLFNKYLTEYYNRILAPIVNNDSMDLSSEVNQLESIKYLTMVLNSGDYIINNLDDLYDKFNNLISEEYKGKFSFDNLKSLYLTVINKSITKLVEIISIDLKFSWRQFENNNWDINESTTVLSNYMIDFKTSLIKNCKIILPLIIRESYIKNFCNKVIDLIIRDFANNLKLIKPISILNIETILHDISDLKQLITNLPLLANPNFDEKNLSDESTDKYYIKFVNTQFQRLETLLKLLLTPTLPVENLVESYFTLIKDKSLKNFRKFLSLKNLTVLEQRKYVDNFNTQLELKNDDLIDESPVLSIIRDEGGSTMTSANNSGVNTTMNASASNVASPAEGSKSPKLKINNLEKNLRELALNSENNITKFNENFKNFGKLFRKDHQDN